MEAILGRKLEMTQVFDEDNNLVPVTVVRAGPCVVVQVKTEERDGYRAAQIGLVEPFSAKKWTKPLQGHVERADVPPVKVLREVSLKDDEEVRAGQAYLCGIFKPGDVVNVTGASKGRGFQGVMRRHGFAGGRATHGSMFHRAPGAIGQAAYPSRVFKGMRMAGQMGNRRVTIKNLEVVKVDEENDLLLLRGALPGARNSLVMVTKTPARNRAGEEA
jgi:large subunit ribosomal protein L3